MIYSECIFNLCLALGAWFLCRRKTEKKKMLICLVSTGCVLSLISAAFVFILADKYIFRELTLFWILFCCAILDYSERLIPDYLSLAAAVAGLSDLIPEFINGTVTVSLIADRLAGGITVFVIMFVAALIMKNGLGGGDIKLMTALGLGTGFGGIFSLLFLCFLPAALFGLVMLALKKVSLKTCLPFAPFVFAGLTGGYAFSVIYSYILK